MSCSRKLAIYGITQNTETKEYLMVFQYANNGSLHKYLRKNFCNLTWQTKLQILKDISDDLYWIHNTQYIHADFHSGNILQDQQDDITTYIADLGLSIKKEEKALKEGIYGVMPYVALEVLSGKQQFTQAADIYGFGVIMTEMTSGQRPFDGHKFNTKLAVKILQGLRSEFAPGTPKCYIELAEKCMNSDPQKRPNVWNINKKIVGWFDTIALFNKINDWLENIASSNDNEIKDLLKKIASLNDNEFNNLLIKIDDNKIKNWLKEVKDLLKKIASLNNNEIEGLLEMIASSNNNNITKENITSLNNNEFEKFLNQINDDKFKNWAKVIFYSIDNEIKDWHVKLTSSNDFNEIKNLLKKMACNKIAKQFIDADKHIISLPKPKHSDELYTSKLISTKLISKAIMAQADSAEIN
ncbi:kinase-like domain-containing protein [Gigaspora rosea]|uniref:Kinase-like domain-containing protein n=1 Tax=Gigaspora rosea TaxID=44941 RepID=A0A397W8U9_9GLOM|nr:kinase-like domain-containing protein [Gigaspora rosea]